MQLDRIGHRRRLNQSRFRCLLLKEATREDLIDRPAEADGHEQALDPTVHVVLGRGLGQCGRDVDADCLQGDGEQDGEYIPGDDADEKDAGSLHGIAPSLSRLRSGPQRSSALAVSSGPAATCRAHAGSGHTLHQPL